METTVTLYMEKPDAVKHTYITLYTSKLNRMDKLPLIWQQQD